MRLEAGVALNCCLVASTYAMLLVGLISVASVSIIFQNYYQSISPPYISRHYNAEHTASYYTATSTSAAVAFLTCILCACMAANCVATVACDCWGQDDHTGSDRGDIDLEEEEELVLGNLTSRSSKKCSVS